MRGQSENEKVEKMDLYTAVSLIALMLLVVSALAIHSSHTINHRMRRNGLWTCLLIGLALVFEWAGIKIGEAGPSWIVVHKLAKWAEFCTAPLIGVMATASYGKIKHPKLIAALSVAHILFETVALHFGLVIRVDSANVYHRGILYPIYVVVFSLSAFFCITSVLRTELRQYGAPSSFSLAILAFLVLGVCLQLFDPALRTDYLCVAISNFLLYHDRCKLILQMDGLTGLFNRRCFEKDFEALKAPAVVLLLDIDDFKNLNDTFGHAVGDDYLRETASLLRTAFGRGNSCYRYGGDEFCVLMKKRPETAGDCIAAYEKMIAQKQAADSRFPGVSVGYAVMEKGKDIRKALKEADEMMYSAKKQARGQLSIAP